MRVIGMWLRIDLRRRWRSLAVLGLLIVLAGVIVVAFVAGARRGTSALPRLERVTRPATVAVLPNLPGFDWSRVEALPEVASVSTIAIDYALSVQGLPAGLVTFPPVNDAVLRSIEKPVVLAGRVFDPVRDDEVVVTPKFVATTTWGWATTSSWACPRPGSWPPALAPTRAAR